MCVSLAKKYVQSWLTAVQDTFAFIDSSNVLIGATREGRNIDLNRLVRFTIGPQRMMHGDVVGSNVVGYGDLKVLCARPRVCVCVVYVAAFCLFLPTL